MKELLDILIKKTSEGPIYVCTCCQQLWFKHSVYNVNEIYFKTAFSLFTHAELNLFQEMVKSGYVKLAEIVPKRQKFPNCQSRIKWAFYNCHQSLNYIQWKKDSLQ